MIPIPILPLPIKVLAVSILCQPHLALVLSVPARTSITPTNQITEAERDLDAVVDLCIPDPGRL